MSPRFFVTTIIALFLCLACTASGAFSNLRLKTAASWAENISRSSSALDWADAMTYEVEIAADHRRQFTSNLTGMVQFQAGALLRPQYNRNDELNLGVTGELKQKFDLGPMAPILTATGSVTGKSARMSGNDGWTATGALNASKRLTESWRLSATADWHNHYADSDTFNVRYQRIFGELFWDITDRWQVSYGYGRFWGDFTANASPVIWPRAIGGLLGPAIFNYYNAMPWEVTDSYGPGWVTYRVYGKSRLWWLQVSPALTDRTSLSLRYDSVFTVNKVNVKYRTDKWTLSLLHNF